jgi:hypothetical protein
LRQPMSAPRSTGDSARTNYSRSSTGDSPTREPLPAMNGLPGIPSTASTSC